jgi:hypothetical protein
VLPHVAAVVDARVQVAGGPAGPVGGGGGGHGVAGVSVGACVRREGRGAGERGKGWEGDGWVEALIANAARCPGQAISPALLCHTPLSSV